MNIADVLLNEKELGELCFAPTTKCDTYCDKCQDRNKAQCLKLLEWLVSECDTKKHHIDWSGDSRRLACSSCMSELESKLKEGR